MRHVLSSSVVVLLVAAGVAYAQTAPRSLTAIPIPTLGGYATEVTGLNESGQVVGRSLLENHNAYHAFFWSQARGTIDLGTLGGPSSSANAINATGLVVGWADTSDT